MPKNTETIVNIHTSEELSLRWVDTDSKGLQLVSPFFGASINGSCFFPVEDIIKAWDKRDFIKKPGQLDEGK